MLSLLMTSCMHGSALHLPKAPALTVVDSHSQQKVLVILSHQLQPALLQVVCHLVTYFELPFWQFVERHFHGKLIALDDGLQVHWL